MALSKLSSKHKPSGKRNLWSEESTLAAVKQVEGGMGFREASRLYKLYSLRRRVNGTVSLHCRSGPSTVLTNEEEDSLARYCVRMADVGFGLTQENVMRTTFTDAERSGRVHPFTDGMVG